MEEVGGGWFNREGVTGRIRSRRRWLTVTSEGGNTTPARVFFFFLFFFFFSFFSLPVRCSGLGGGQVGGWVGGGEKEILDLVQNTSTALTPLSLNRLRPSSCQTAVSHAVRCTVTWAVGPGITDRFVCEPPTRLPFPIPVATKRADIPTSPHPSLCVRTRKSAIFIFFLRRRPYSPDRQSNPSFSLLLIRNSRRLPPAVDPLPHLPHFPPHNPSDED